MRVTLLSDTHGLLRPEAVELARRSEVSGTSELAIFALGVKSLLPAIPR